MKLKTLKFNKMNHGLLCISFLLVFLLIISFKKIICKNSNCLLDSNKYTEKIQLNQFIFVSTISDSY